MIARAIAIPRGLGDRPLIAHVLFRFDVGGLENGVVNLINRMAPAAYRHAVISLTGITGFRQRIARDDVVFVALDKPPGHALGLYPRLVRLFRELKPAIVHTRNLAALEVAVPARLARVPVTVHGEHGRDVDDLDGSSRKHQWIRRLYRPFVDHYVALSRDLERYLTQKVGVPPARVTHICNGVDTTCFYPASTRAAIPGSPFTQSGLWIVGTVGRMQEVKDQTTLARAFVKALQLMPELRQRLRLIMVGDGPLKARANRVLADAGMQDFAWLPGERADVPQILRGLDCFVLPSLAEGISNTILEAMASGLPVIATGVGGNAELLESGVTGLVVPPADPFALAVAITAYARDGAAARDAGGLGRVRAERCFSLDSMTTAYHDMYDSLLRDYAAAGQ